MSDESPRLKATDGFRLGEVKIEPSANEIDGVSVDAKSMDVLVVLAETAPNVLSVAALLDRVWPNVVVVDNVVHRAIATLRKALGDNARAPRYLQSIPRRGYRLIAPVQRTLATISMTTQPSAPTHNLPASLTSFIGRDEAVQSVAVLLESARLVTLTGTGGTGKTRLALAVAERVLPNYRDGVWFVGLGAVSDPDLVAVNVAQVFGVQDAPGVPISTSLQRHLREKQLLLIVDNFEQVLPAASLLTTLLTMCSGFTVLVTSRVLLQVSGEHDWPVLPLVVPTAPSDDVADAPAVRLFVERAQAARADFRLTRETAPTVVDICRRLDGLPLALELAAARIRLLSPMEILSRLEHRLTLLTSGGRDQPVRQQTLRNAIAWSYDLLVPALQILFRRLAIFSGGWNLDAVEAVCANESELDLDTLEGVTTLVTASLVVQVADADGQARFSMLETVREYALEQLDANDEREQQQRALATFWVDLAQRVGPQLLGPGRMAWQQRLQSEQENLRTTISWIIDRREAQLGTELIAPLWFWLYQTRPSEGRRWVEAILALPPAAGASRTRARALMGLAVLCWAQYDASTAESALRKSVDLWREIGSRSGLADALAWAPYCWVSNRTAAREAGEESVTLYRSLNAPTGLGWALNTLAGLNIDLGDYDAAQAQAEESERIFDSIGDRYFGSLPKLHLQRIAMILGKADTSLVEKRTQERIALFREQGDKRNMAGDLRILAHLVRKRGGSDAVWVDSIREALDLWREIGNDAWATTCLVEVAIRIGTAGRTLQAVQLMAAAAAVRETLSVSDDKVVWTFAEAEQHVPSWRAELGDEDFSAAWTEGRRLTLEQAVDQAKEQAAQMDQAGSAIDVER